MNLMGPRKPRLVVPLQWSSPKGRTIPQAQSLVREIYLCNVWLTASLFKEALTKIEPQDSHTMDYNILCVIYLE